jgi:hypothetical protein
VPAAVAQSTTEYRESSDAFGEFFSDELDFVATARVTSAELYRAYKRWAAQTGVIELSSQQDLAASLEARGCTKTRGGGGVRGWLGVCIRCSSPQVSDTGDSGDGDSRKTAIAKNDEGNLPESASPASPVSPWASTRHDACQRCGAFNWLVVVGGMRCEQCGAFVEASS